MSRTETEWISVDPATHTVQRREPRDGFDVTLIVSPYDVPRKFRGYYDEDERKFVIEFRYLGTELVKRIQPAQYVEFLVGKNSERIYKIEIDVKKAGAQWVKLTLKAIEAGVQRRRTPRREMNYAIASQLLKEKEPELRRAAG